MAGASSLVYVRNADYPAGEFSLKRVDTRTYFERYAQEYDHWHRKNRYYYDYLTRWFRFVVPEHQKVFEIGAGDGRLVAALGPSSYGGIDFIPEMVEKARERHPHGDFRLGDARDGLGDDETYDYIIGADVLMYLEDIQDVLERVREACHEKTRVIFTKLNPFWELPMRLAAALGFAQKRAYSSWLSLGQTAQLARLAGFEVIRTGKFCLLPVYVPILSTLLNRFFAHLPILWRASAVEYVIARVDPPRMGHETRPSVSVVIPARNEAGNIEPALDRMPSFPGELEVIFVEGHSTDDTWQKIQDVQTRGFPFRILAEQQEGRGKGDAVRKGFSVASGDLLMILDADLTVPPELLPRFYRVLAERSSDYVQGTRLVYPMESKAMRPLNWLGNKLFSYLLSTLIGQRFSDTLCGTKCLWRADYELLAANRAYFGRLDPFGDFDLIFGAAKLNLKMEEIPVRYGQRVYGDTNINRFRDGFLLLRMCWLAARKLYFV